MDSILYLDHAATTPPSEAVIAAASRMMREQWGNPSSVHAVGFAANRAREEARKQVFSLLGIKATFAKPEQLIFTASGTESDNLAILGVARAKKYPGTPRLILTDSEHPAVLAPAAVLEKEGWDVIRLSTKDGVIDPEELKAALTPSTVLVSIMAANNETGACYDLKNLFAMVHRICPNALTHTDAVQAFGKIPILPEKIGADLVSVSAHKLHGIKGAGALWCSAQVLKRRALSPTVFGGGQEGGFRSGTEAMPAIVGFGVACAEATEYGFERYEADAASLRKILLAHLDERVRVNTPKGAYLPSTVSLTLPAIRSEIMLRYLSGEGICVSAGSACASNHPATSKSLLAFGLSTGEADSTIRVSFDSRESEESIIRFCQTLTKGIDSLATTEKRGTRR